jgi:antirestriction protein ArdC
MSKVYEVVTDRIIDQLNKGVVPWRKPWNTNSGLGQCKNLCSLKPYRGINAFMTALSGYNSPYWLTYNQAKELGANVRAGEKGIPITYFMKLEIEDMKTGEDKEIPLMRYYTVFNVEQIDNLKLKPEFLFPGVKTNEFTPIESCEKIVELMPQKPRIEHDKSQAYYVPSLDYINMPKKELFTSPEEYYSTLFHELTHSTGHESRLKRRDADKVAAFGTAVYSKEELVAEMGSAFLCAKAGIENSTVNNSAAYIASWLKVLKSDSKLLISAASQAQKSSDFILGAK